MSHVAKYETTIGKNGCVNETLLKKAVEIAAKEMGGEVGNSYDGRYEGKNLKAFQGQSIMQSIRTKEMPEGMGVILTKDKKIQFVHDLDGNTTAFRKAQVSVEKNYRTLAIAVAVKNMGYNVHTNTHANGSVVITGEEAPRL